ncbi:MAG: magnesium transporter CorA family protein [Lachnospiraceae bacterium]|nr:magnesium transporter CorA family protein [Lachnospiraceae bacterium]
MVNIFRTDNGKTHKLEEIVDGAWIEMSAPTTEEIQHIVSSLNLEKDDVMAAIDPEEKIRVEVDDEYTLILVDIPAKEIRHNVDSYTTIPLGIILTEHNIVTICSEETPILNYFHDSRIRDFSTKKKLRFVYQIMLRTAMFYQQVLTVIDKTRTEFEESIERITDEQDLVNLHELESTLVYFATSLRGNGNVLNRLTRYGRLQQYPEDRELLDDVIVENQQAIEMTQIYRDIIDGTSDLMSSILDLRLNKVMKRLTSVTLILSIPTVISGLYGMNVDTQWMPLAHTIHGFGIICLITLIICIFLMLYLRKKKML